MSQRLACTREMKATHGVFMPLSSPSRHVTITYAPLTNLDPTTNTLSFPHRMLGRVARISLRRGIHTASSSSPAYLSRHKLATAVGASIVAASYLGWRMNLEGRRIALDSDGARTSGSPFRYLLLIAPP